MFNIIHVLYLNACIYMRLLALTFVYHLFTVVVYLFVDFCTQYFRLLTCVLGGPVPIPGQPVYVCVRV